MHYSPRIQMQALTHGDDRMTTPAESADRNPPLQSSNPVFGR